MSSARHMTREQQRASHAWRCAEQVLGQRQPDLLQDYKVAVDDLGSTVLRCGLAASLAFLERQGKNEKSKTGAHWLLDHLAEHLAGAGLPGLRLEQGKAGQGLALTRQVREALSVAEYMHVTREVLRLAPWLVRAVQATFPRAEKEQGHGADAR